MPKVEPEQGPETSIEELVAAVASILTLHEGQGEEAQRAAAASTESLGRQVVGDQIGPAAAAVWTSWYERVVAMFEREPRPAWEAVVRWLAEQARDTLRSAGGDGSLTVDESAARVELRWATACLREYQSDKRRLDLLSASVDGLERLAEVLPTSHPARPAVLTNLAVAYKQRQRSPRSQSGDIDRAVAAACESAELTEPSDFWYGSRVLNRGSAFRDRYERTATIRNLVGAVAALRELFDGGLLPVEHRAMAATNVGQGLRELFEVTTDRTHLKDSMRYHRAAIRLARAHSPTVLPRALGNAGSTMRLWHSDAAGIRQAIAWKAEALTLTGATEPERPDRLYSLAWAWLDLARVERSLEHAETALALADESVAAYSHDSPNRRHPLLARAAIHKLHWKLTGDQHSLEAALADYNESLDCAADNGLASVLSTALENGRRAAEATPRDLTRALTFFERGLSALDALLSGQLIRRDQRSWQRFAQDLAASAAVALVSCERFEEAVLLLDSYRVRESALLASVARMIPATQDTMEPARQAQQAVAEWIDAGGPASDLPVERRIGQVLGDRAAADVRAIARQTTVGEVSESFGRHVLYLVCSELGGAVIVVRPDRTVAARRLPKLTIRAVRNQVTRIRRAYNSRDTLPYAFDDALERYGRWAGAQIAGPMSALVPLDAPLALVPCGPLAELPILAAWRPARDGRREHPFLGRAIVFAASAHPPRPLSRPQQIGSTVAVDGEPWLFRSIARTEAQALGICHPPHRIDGQTADPLSLMPKISGYDIIHFSCHGVVGALDAVETAVCLSKANLLTVANILKGELSTEALVVLASCATASPDPTLPDQTFGLPAAFLHSGARAVIAPAFEVSRSAAVMLTVRFYYVIAQGLPPDEALAVTQQWISESTGTDKADFLDDMIRKLTALGQPTDALELLSKLLRNRPSDADGSSALSAWCTFAAHV